MRVKDMLKHKGTVVVTVRPDASCRALLAVLAEHNIGAVVVSENGISVDGIVSERDVVRHLNEHGDAILDGPVSEIAVWQVSTCGLDDSVNELCTTMTERRIRHLPVVDAGRLVGIISIGDVVKERVAEAQHEVEALTNYIHS